MPTIGRFSRFCTKDTSKTYVMNYNASASYSTSTDSGNNITYSNFKVTLSRSSTDNGYKSYCPSEDGKCIGGCCSGGSVQTASSLSGGWTTRVSFSSNYAYGSTTFGTYSIPGSVTLAPGESTRVPIAYFSSCASGSYYMTLTNNLKKPEPSPPSATLSCSPSTTNASAITFSGGGSNGYCENQRNSSSYTVSQGDTVIKSGSGSPGTITGLNPNTTYSATYSRSNGCYTRSTSCSATTLTPNTLSEPTSTSPYAGKVRVFVTYGGGVYKPTTTVQYRQCGTSNWKTAGTTTTTNVAYVDVTGLEPETCYEVQALTRTTAGTYTGNTVTFTTPKKGAFAYIDSIEPELDPDTFEARAQVCFHWESEVVPAEITVYYRVKDGYDTEWLHSSTMTVDTQTGTGCLRLRDLYPNAVEYEVYLHTNVPSIGAEWDGDTQTFITPIVPEPNIYTCKNINYVVALLCQAVRTLYKGNKEIYANPATKAQCDPYSENPTLLTLWSRYLRVAHMILCLQESMLNSSLSVSQPGQYLVGEAGWQNIVTAIDENDEDALTRLATSGAAFDYIAQSIHQVWHLHGSVDYLVENLSDLDGLENATTAIIASEDKVYKKDGDTWVVDDSMAPDDFAVYHIRYASNTGSYKVNAGSAWYYWQGSWNSLDADVAEVSRILDPLWDNRSSIVLNEEGATPLNVMVTNKDDNFDYSTLPENERWLSFVTEPVNVLAPTYRTITYNANGGQAMTAQQVLDGTVPQTPAQPYYDGYDFNGWHDGSATGALTDWSLPVTANKTVYAGWTLKQITGTYDLDGGTYSSGDGTIPNLVTNWNSQTYYTALTRSSLTKTGHSFSGWLYHGVPWTSSYEYPVSDYTLKANWTATTFNVTFAPSNGSSNFTVPTRYGNGVVEPDEPTWAKHRFLGWYTASSGGEKVDFSQPLTGAVTYYAHWGDDVYTVSFDSDGGSAVASQEVSYFGAATEPEDPTRAGYILQYWELDGQEYVFGTPVTGDITLKAVWRAVWEVKFNTDGGTPSTIPTQVVLDGDTAEQPEDPTKAGCTFLGWAKDIDTSDHSINNIRAAIATGHPEDYFPVGTEIPDTESSAEGAQYATMQNPWIIAAYLDVEVVDNASPLTTHTEPGAALVRKFLTPTATAWGNDKWYGQSTVASYIGVTYANGCSDAIRDAAVYTRIKVNNTANSSVVDYLCSFFLPSATEMAMVPSISTNPAQGQLWDYFGATPSNATNTQRVGTRLNSSTIAYPTRTGGSYSWYMDGINTDGSYVNCNEDSKTTYNYRPACFIVGLPLPDPEPEPEPGDYENSIEGLKKALDEGRAEEFFPPNSMVPAGMTVAAYAACNWVVGQYGTATTSDGEEQNGVYLFLDRAVPDLGLQHGNYNYPNSELFRFCNTEFYDFLPQSTKDIVSNIRVSFGTLASSATCQQTYAKCWPLGGQEVGLLTNCDNIPIWDAWRTRLGTDVRDNGANNGRIMKNTSGNDTNWLLRDDARLSSGNWNPLGINYLGGSTYFGYGERVPTVPAIFIKSDNTPSKYDSTLVGLKEALDAGEAETYFPVGTELPDTWNNEENPLIVAQYLDSSNNTAYGGAEGALLVRKFVEPTNQWDKSYGANYPTSSMRTYLNSSYQDSCSAELKGLISPITIKWHSGNGTIDVPDNYWFLLSAYEVCCKGDMYESQYEGIMLDYWKERTGLTEPDTAFVNNAGRVMTNRNGDPLATWLRSTPRANYNYPYYIATNGAVSDANPINNYGVLPVCFLPKTTPPQQ